MKGYPEGIWVHPKEQRVSPLDEKYYTTFQRFLLWRIRKEAGSNVNLNVFRVFIRLGNIFFKYLLFMLWIMQKGKIAWIEKEKIILRVAWRMGCVYEWAHHVHLGLKLGLKHDEIDGIAKEGSVAWSPEMRAKMLAVDELIAKHNISDEVWKELKKYLNEDQMVEFCMLVGHYIMVALTNNTLGISVEPHFELK